MLPAMAAAAAEAATEPEWRRASSQTLGGAIALGGGEGEEGERSVGWEKEEGGEEARKREKQGLMRTRKAVGVKYQIQTVLARVMFAYVCLR